jgi:hypothetical protein
MSDEPMNDLPGEMRRRAFLRRMVAVGFAVPAIMTFEPALAWAAAAPGQEDKDEDKDKDKTTTTTTTTTVPPPTTTTTTVPLS